MFFGGYKEEVQQAFQRIMSAYAEYGQKRWAAFQIGLAFQCLTKGPHLLAWLVDPIADMRPRTSFAGHESEVQCS